MKIWNVDVKATVTWTCDVQAETEEDAIRYARDLWVDCDVDEIVFWDEEFHAEEV